MFPPFDAFVFDFDGTLAVLNLDFDDMRRQVLDLVAAQGLQRQSLQHMYILEMIEHAAALLHQQSPDRASAFHREAHQLLRDIEVEAAHGSTLFPGVPELLEALRQQRIGVGIVTRNCAAAVRIMFPHIDVYCQAFLPRDQVPQVKPHPAHLQAALTQLGSTPTRTIMVGDGALDIQAGKALGMFSVGVLSGTSSRDSLLGQGADLILERVADVLPYVPPHRGGRA